MENNLTQTDLQMLRRPGRNTTGKELALQTNYFKFTFPRDTQTRFYKYSVDFTEPELPADSSKLRAKIFRKAKAEIEQVMGLTIFNNTTCYTRAQIEGPQEFSSTHDEQVYKIKIKFTNVVESQDVEALSLYKRFFGLLVRRINFIPMRRNFFDPTGSKMVQNVEVWPGFNSSINIFNGTPLLNMNIIYKVLRQDSALDSIKKFKERFRNNDDFISEVQEAFKNTIVLTRYNNDKTYIVDSIDFGKSPKDTFPTKDGEISYMDYYSKKYAFNIQDLSQPLLVSVDKKKNEKIYLIPEFCKMTGLTDEMRSNFNMMKEMAVITKGSAAEKMKECTSKIQLFLNNEICQKDIAAWQLTLSDSPVGLAGRKLDAGNILMHKTGNNSRFSFPIEATQDIDRKIQTEMYSQPPLSKWCLFCTERDRDTANTFMQTLKQVQGSFKYNMAEPKTVYVKSQNFRDWEEAITKTIQQDVQAVVLVMPGAKGKGCVYNEVKRLLCCRFPIPSQVVLSSTVSKPKGLRSVVNKVLMQICAKVSGEPWAVDNLPFTKKPTMVVGIDVYNKNGLSIIGCCGSYNNTFTKYTSVAKTAPQGSDLSASIAEAVSECSKQFEKINKIAPQHLVILRDGVSPSSARSVFQSEVRALLQACETVPLTYILLNKKNNLKLFLKENSNYTNPPQGTVVDDVIVDKEAYDFYLISQKSNQGLPQPTQYNVMYDSNASSVEDIHNLVYKLSYLYYNWTGAIKIPAPCQYAKKLAFLVGDKLSTRSEVVLPGERFNNEIRSLFFL